MLKCSNFYFSEESIIKKNNNNNDIGGMGKRKSPLRRSNLIKVLLELFYYGFTNLRLILMKNYMVVLKTGYVIYYEYFDFSFLLNYERIVGRSSSGD